MKREVPSTASNDWAARQLQGAAPKCPGFFDDRRDRAERRHRVVWSVLYGSFHPRRRAPPRRLNDSRFHSLDWYSAHLLAVSVAILLLCVADAFMTLLLLSSGADEVNPVMATVVHGNVALFTAIKMGLTGLSVVIMVFLARYRLLRVVRVDAVLYAILVGYIVLIGYEFWMLRQPAGAVIL